MIKILFLILTYTLLSIYPSLGQQYYSKNYTINDGLPDNCIREIYKDSRGFLWLGTDAGLSRFDGKNFIVYTSQDGLIGDEIWSLAESEEGNIWIGCHDGGISKLNGKEIISYNTESGLISNEVRILYYSLKHKILLIGTEDGLSIYNKGKFISFHKKLKNVNQRLQITQFIEKDDSIFVFTNGNGIYKYDPGTENLKKIHTDHPLNKNLTNSAYISSSKDTLINFNQKKLISIKNGKMIISDFIGQVTDYKEDINHNIWIAAWNNNSINAGGLFKLDSSGITNFGNSLGIKSTHILSLEFDLKENLLWIGTKEYGLFLYPITNFSYFESSYFKLPELNITDLDIDKSNILWIATKKNVIKKNDNEICKIFSFDMFNTKFEHFIENTIKYKYLIDPSGSFEKYQQLILSGTYPFSNPYKILNKITSPPKSLHNPLKYNILANKKLSEFNSIITDSIGNIWVGSNVGIFKIDKNTEEIRYVDLEGNQFNNFSFDSEDKLYCISPTDLFIYPDIENNSNYYLYNYNEKHSSINITNIKNQNNKIWFISADNGFFFYDKSKFHSTYDHKTIDSKGFNAICFDNFGNIIFGSNNGKIYITEFSNDTIIFKFEITKKNGLSGTSIRWLNCTNDNVLIAGTNAGLNLINLNDLYNAGNIHVKTIDKSEGFIDYSGEKSVIQNDKYLWIASNTYLIKTDLKKLKKEKNKYINFYIKSIEVNDEIINLKNLKNVDLWTNIPESTLKLPYYKNSITFNYDAIMYLNYESISFSYKLEGYHRNWVKETKDRKAIFQNLKPGNYRLRINVLNENENITSKELSISFIISSPIWLKWWFISSAISFILFLIWLTIFFRTKSIKRKERLRAEISERISEFEMKALRSQMNPHFIFNAINSIQNYMLDNDIDSSLSYLSDFAKLIRLTLDNVSKKRISLDDELSYLKHYLNLEQMRFDKKFETEIILPPDYENRKYLIPSMIIQPYVENSIKYGFISKNDGGKIKLEFQVSDDNILKCIIEDNGIGRNKSRELNKNKKSNQSKGTFITKERLSLLNQTQQRKGYKIEVIDLYDEYNLACGTRVEIFIPI